MTGDGNAAAAIWAELSETMRRLRQSAGHSIRWAESESGRGRGLLSQVETGKAHPNRGLVEWYDGTFAGDGLLLSMFFEARTAHGPDAGARPDASAEGAELGEVSPKGGTNGATNGGTNGLANGVAGPMSAAANGAANGAAIGAADTPWGTVAGGQPAGGRLLVLDQLLPQGSVVPPGSDVPVGWTVRNDGVAAWTSVRLRRVGTPVSSRMLSGPALLPVPDTAAGATTSMTTHVRTPLYVGTYAAFWELIDAADRLVVPGVPLSALVIVRS